MATSTVQERLSDQEVAAVLWTAVQKASSKEADRDALRSQDSRTVRLMITGEVDGQTIHRSLHGTLKIGADQERAVSATPDQPMLVALILSKLNKATREKILADLPEQFAALGTWPEVSPTLVQAAEQMLSNIRSHKTIKVRGNVRFNYDVAKLDPKPPRPHSRFQRPARTVRRTPSPRCREQRRCAK